MVTFAATPQYGVSPSMNGAENDEPALAEHLKEYAPLGSDGREALRMADAQQTELRAATVRKAVEIAMQELLAAKV